MKVCTKCKEEKELSEFYNKKSNKDGYKGDCKSCSCNYLKKWYEENKEKRKKYREENKEKTKKWREENKEKTKKWYEENKEKLKEYSKKYREENKEKRNEYLKKWYEENKEKRKKYREENKEKTKKWREENKEKLKGYNNEYIKQRIKREPLFKLSTNISSTIRASIKRNGYSKKSRTHEILGCSFETFWYWINDVSDYFGDDKHNDHVIPVSLAETEEDVYLLNNYTNFQYLSAKDNFKKNATYIKKKNLERVLNHHPNPDRLKELVNNSKIEII